MSEEPTLPTSTEEPRHCPECGTRVAQLATTCLMCDASLTEKKEKEPQTSQPRRWPFILAVIGVVLVIVGVAGVLLRPLLLAPPPTATPTSSPTPTSTATPIVAPTRRATATPSPAPPPPRAHQVQEDETLAAIAEQYDTTIDEILALNPGITPELLQVGQVLLIPPAEATPEPVATEGPSPTPGEVHIHVVAPGETLLSIAEQYNVTIALIRAANPDIPPGSDVIQVNQSLIIPIGTPMPTQTPTPNPDASPTPLPLYPSPYLLNPPDGAVFGGPEASITVQWAAVGLLRSNEWYELHVARPGAEPFVVQTRMTAYQIPAELYPPPGSTVREFRWRVLVVQRIPETGTYEQISEPPSVRTFRWLESPPTPTPTPTPSPSPTP